MRYLLGVKRLSEPGKTGEVGPPASGRSFFTPLIRASRSTGSLALRGAGYRRQKREKPMQKPEDQKQATRKGSPPIKVYCLPMEKEQIATKADAAGLSQSTYLLNVGIGYEVQSVIDSRLVMELSKVNADQGRLGGLLKLWLTNDERFAGFDEPKMRATIQAVLSKIEETQAALLDLATRGLKF